MEIQLAELHERLQNEWRDTSRYYSSKPKNVVFEEFKIYWELFSGPAVEEFICVSDSVYNQWSIWKRKNNYDREFTSLYNSKGDFIDKACDHQIRSFTFTEIWNEFKIFWQFDTPESKIMFKEMELLSDNMLREWSMKYNMESIYEGEDFNYDEKGKVKSKAKHWEEFKEIWEIDIDNYNEENYKKMNQFISKIVCNDSDNFYNYRENANYHSFDSYSILEQFDICEYYESRKGKNEYESESEYECEILEDS